MPKRKFESKSFHLYFHFNILRKASKLVIIYRRFIHINLNFNLFDHKLSNMAELFINSWSILSFLSKILPYILYIKTKLKSERSRWEESLGMRTESRRATQRRRRVFCFCIVF